MARKLLINGIFYESTGERKVIVNGGIFEETVTTTTPVPDPDPLDIGLALGPTEYTQGSMYLGDTEIETMFLGGINITQQYVTDENGAYLIDENNNYITYGD